MQSSTGLKVPDQPTFVIPEDGAPDMKKHSGLKFGQKKKNNPPI